MSSQMLVANGLSDKWQPVAVKGKMAQKVLEVVVGCLYCNNRFVRVL
jgi:hypothetical protein